MEKEKIKAEEYVILVYSDSKDELTIECKLSDVLDNDHDYFLENAEPECTSSGCHNESQNFCDCGGIYEDYKFVEMRLTPKE